MYTYIQPCLLDTVVVSVVGGASNVSVPGVGLEGKES